MSGGFGSAPEPRFGEEYMEVVRNPVYLQSYLLELWSGGGMNIESRLAMESRLKALSKYQNLLDLRTVLEDDGYGNPILMRTREDGTENGNINIEYAGIRQKGRKKGEPGIVKITDHRIEVDK